MSTLVSTRSIDPSVPTSRLDGTLLALAEAHAGHAAGAILPCPFCFDPPLDFEATQPSNSSVRSIVTKVSQAVEQAA